MSKIIVFLESNRHVPGPDEIKNLTEKGYVDRSTNVKTKQRKIVEAI